MPGAHPLDAAKYRDDPVAIAEYLNGALSTEDPFLITRAIATMVRAQGMTRFSRKAGIRRDSLYRLSITHKSLAPFASRRLNFLESFESLVIHC
jgi:probable addiction module antidote protein